MSAILVECDPANSLGGSCRRDVINVRNTLIKYGIPDDNIYILCSRCSLSELCKITKYCYLSGQIVEVIKAMASRNPEMIYMHFSGHGYQKTDTSGDEKDYLDEYVNLDGRWLMDDDFYNAMKTHFDPSCKIRVSVDTCHSGTFSDFKYEYDTKWVNSSNRDEYFNNAYSISACSDQQLSMCDVGGIGFGGSLTVHLLDTGALHEFIYGDPQKAHSMLCNILVKLNQRVILCTDKLNML